MRRTAALVAMLALMPACGDGGTKTSSSTTGVVVLPTQTSVATGAPAGVVDYAGLKQDHTTADVTYEQNPPVGGPHDPQWQPCKYYDQPIRTQRGVHSLEHGAVWITYQQSLPADQVQILKDMVKGHDHLLISPFVGLPAPVVASAWGEQLVLQSATDPRLAQFVAFFEQGPQTPEPGAPC